MMYQRYSYLFLLDSRLDSMHTLQHTKDGDLWIVVDSKVYDLSRFAKMHPGGLSVLLDQSVGMSLNCILSSP